MRNFIIFFIHSFSPTFTTTSRIGNEGEMSEEEDAALEAFNSLLARLVRSIKLW
jgi:hypothetical protein